MAKPLVLTVDASVTPLERALRAGKATLADYGASADQMLRKMEQDFQNGFRNSGSALASSLGKTMAAQFNEMKRNAQAAVEMGKNWDPMGGTNSQSSAKAATGYQQTAEAANLRVDAIRRVIQAEVSAGAIDQGRLLQLKTMLVATKELAQGMEEQAAVSRAQAVAFAAVEAEMGKVIPAADNVTSAHGRMGIAGQMMMHSVRSATDSYAAGLPVMMIFSEQIGRLAEASVYAADASDKTTGAMATFGRVMGGPWGLAITAGISLLGTVAGQMDLFGNKVDEGVRKLKEQADATHLADQAQAIFDNTLDGAIAREHKLTDELNKQIKSRRELIGLQVAQAQQDAINDKATVDTTRKAYEDAVKKRNQTSTTPGYGEAGRVAHDEAVTAADKDVIKARDDYFEAVDTMQKAQDRERANKGIQIAQSAKDQATPQTKRQAELETRRDSLTGRFNRGSITEEDYRTQLDAIETQLADNKQTPRKARVDHTAARDAEAEKKSDAAYDEGYAADLDALAKIARENVTDKTELARLDKEEIDAARVRQRRATEEEGRRNKWSAPDIADRQGLQDQAVDARKRQVDKKLTRDLSDQDLERQQRALSAQDQFLQLQGQLAITLRERRDIAMKLLDNEKQSALLGVQRDVNSGKMTVDEGAQENANINARYGLQSQQAARQFSGPMDQWKQGIVNTAGDMDTALQNVASHGLQGLEDGLTGLISGTEKAGQAFTKMASSILADLGRLALEKGIMLAFGLSSGGKVEGRATGGLLGLATGGRIPGFAGGTRLSNGMIRGPGTGTSDSILAMVNGSKPIRVSNDEGIVNAQAVRNYWPVIDAMNKGTFKGFSTGGILGSTPALSYPKLPSAKSLQTPTMHYTFAPNFTGAVMTQDLLAQMNGMSQYHANQAGSAALAAAPELTQQRMTQKSNQRIPS